VSIWVLLCESLQAQKSRSEGKKVWNEKEKGKQKKIKINEEYRFCFRLLP
jgi:hypothetical protein